MSRPATNPPTVYGFGHEGYYRNVLAVLRGERHSLIVSHEAEDAIDDVRHLNEKD